MKLFVAALVVFIGQCYFVQCQTMSYFIFGQNEQKDYRHCDLSSLQHKADFEKLVNGVDPRYPSKIIIFGAQYNNPLFEKVDSSTPDYSAVDSFLDSQSSVENAAVILTRMNDRFKIQYIEILRKLKSVCTTRTFCVAQLNLPNGLMYPQNVAYYMHGGQMKIKELIPIVYEGLEHALTDITAKLPKPTQGTVTNPTTTTEQPRKLRPLKPLVLAEMQLASPLPSPPIQTPPLDQSRPKLPTARNLKVPGKLTVVMINAVLDVLFQVEYEYLRLYVENLCSNPDGFFIIIAYADDKTYRSFLSHLTTIRTLNVISLTFEAFPIVPYSNDLATAISA